ncbi:MAG: dihydropteroate synthase [Bacteroidota bacterium]
MAQPYMLNCRGKLLDLSAPQVMGILNVTPDSFSDGGLYQGLDAALEQAGRMLAEGASIIDVGGYSSRPGAADVSVGEELDRVGPVCERILAEYPEAIISVDTFRPEVAKPLLEAGVHIINDISAGTALGQGEIGKPGMMEVLQGYPDVPYVMMHMQGNPATMQDQPAYNNVVEEVSAYLVERVNTARSLGLRDLIIDPGFGFGKTQLHNYQLFGALGQFCQMGVPVLVGISRKSMLYRFLEVKPTEVLEVATALHFQAILAGAAILRVHDVKPVAQAIRLYEYMRAHGVI